MRAALLASCLLVSSALLAQDKTPEESRTCVESVVIADVTHYDPNPLPEHEEGVFVTRWPWTLTTVVRQHLHGPKTPRRISVRASLHTQFNPEIQNLVMFLSKGEGRQYWLEGIEYRFIRDSRGRLVMPVEAPLPEGWLQPEGFLPANYEALLRPVKYRAKDAWWLELPTLFKKEPADFPWGTVRGDYIVADRGLYLKDMLTHLKAPSCPPPAE
jgi:hypothetical protein